MSYKKRTECAVCKSTNLKIIMEYGNVPLAGYFPKNLNSVLDFTYNMDLIYCEECSLVQTDSIIDGDVLFEDYRYMSSVGLSGHFKEVAKMLVEDFNPYNLLEIGSNDGVLLLPLVELGVDAIGVDPASNVVDVALSNGCNVFKDYFSENFVVRNQFEKKFDMIVANNCFAHIDGIHSIVRGAKLALSENGRMVIEVHYIKDLIEKNQYETVYHEHLYYYSVSSLHNLFEQYGMTIERVDRIPIHGGSIRVIISNQDKELNSSIISILTEEKKSGLTSFDHFKNFGDVSRQHINKIKNKVADLKKLGSKIVGYGASGRGNIFCKLCNLDSEQIDYIVDESPERVGRFTPNTGIPIVSKKVLDDDYPDYIFIFAWNYSKMIIDKLKGRGFKFIIAFPDLVIVEDSKELDETIFI